MCTTAALLQEDRAHPTFRADNHVEHFKLAKRYSFLPAMSTDTEPPTDLSWKDALKLPAKDKRYKTTVCYCFCGKLMILCEGNRFSAISPIGFSSIFSDSAGFASYHISRHFMRTLKKKEFVVQNSREEAS
ncbi:unnamed protein product [Gongylonema pulchrum]|uniref:Uncharacterized protein n=1 Tax=Gongylonema pulchrum TaxID=637853 RepID=A0A183EDQ4_9BILA|nr:unnamed protein product [Gongylonema pulchrum]